MTGRITNEQREAIVREAIAKRDALLRDPEALASEMVRQMRADGALSFPEEATIAGAPPKCYSPEDRAFYRWWYSHMKSDLMQPPLTEVSHSTARYIWDAALAARV